MLESSENGLEVKAIRDALQTQWSEQDVEIRDARKKYGRQERRAHFGEDDDTLASTEEAQDRSVPREPPEAHATEEVSRWEKASSRKAWRTRNSRYIWVHKSKEMEAPAAL